MAKILTGFQRNLRKVNVYLLADEGVEIPKSTLIGYYGYYAVMAAAVVGLCMVAV